MAACAIALAASCAHQSGPPPTCCAAPGYTRTQVESVLGKPAPPQTSRWHPFPSPPPDAPIYTTEHGYLTVSYAGSAGLATHLSLDFYEGKAPDDAFNIVAAYLPRDAIDSKGRVVGPKAVIRVYTSALLEKALPVSRGVIYVECTGAQPSMLCERADIVTVGKP